MLRIFVIIYILTFLLVAMEKPPSLSLKLMNNFEKLAWKTDWNRAFSQAEKENKNLIVMVEEESCKWCRKMKKEALSDRRVQNLLKKYVLLKLKRSNKTEVKKLESFDGNIPSLFFMRPTGEIVDSIVGYYTTEDFLGYIREIESDGF